MAGSVNQRLPEEDLVVVGSVEPTDACFFVVVVLPVEVSCPGVLVGRGGLDDEHAGHVRAAGSELLFDFFEEGGVDEARDHLVEEADVVGFKQVDVGGGGGADRLGGYTVLAVTA
ncbi:MAG: hypothetical protein M3Q68_08160 [Actinomycetota bacterium]|nr:hypothetical protein [Actinomycetota bacterium]